MDTYFEEYIRLRNDLDLKIAEVENLHSSHINCKKGCDSCCESIRVFPIEFYTIIEELKKEGFVFPRRRFNAWRKSCVFLKGGACLIYKHRPFICRTQGLPLMYQSLKIDGYEVSHCTINFKGVDINSFNADNTLFMPDFNSKLILLNKQFVENKDMFGRNFKKRLSLYKICYCT